MNSWSKPHIWNNSGCFESNLLWGLWKANKIATKHPTKMCVHFQCSSAMYFCVATGWVAFHGSNQYRLRPQRCKSHLSASSDAKVTWARWSVPLTGVFSIHKMLPGSSGIVVCISKKNIYKYQLKYTQIYFIYLISTKKHLSYWPFYKHPIWTYFGLGHSESENVLPTFNSFSYCPNREHKFQKLFFWGHIHPCFLWLGTTGTTAIPAQKQTTRVFICRFDSSNAWKSVKKRFAVGWPWLFYLGDFF